MFNKLTGTALLSAQISIARYCLQLEQQSGLIDISHVVTNINDAYNLVHRDLLPALINDVSLAFLYVKNQQVVEMSRAGYWKFKALSPFVAKQVLDSELQALGA